MVRKKPRVSMMRRLHRTLGASAAAFILFMAFSGIVINHAQNLGLGEHHVSQPLLLRWYGFDEPREIRSYAAGGHWLSFADSSAYFNGHYISALSDGVGLVFTGEMLIAAGAGELLLLDPQGGLIEKLPWDQPEAGLIESIGIFENGSVVVKSAGEMWMTDAQLLKWRRIDKSASNPAWSEPSSEPERVRQTVIAQYRGAGLSMERLILDLHSGRIFGSAGILIYDLLAIIVVFLAISGIVFWFRGRHKGKKRYP